MLRCEVGCGPEYDGWYPRLFYRGHDDAMREEDFTIVDIHTAPTDASGAPVGWVLHGGTGPFNLGVWIADTPGGGSRAYVGPVMSYYEHLTTGFKRLTDEEWETLYMRPPSMRPDFVRLYLAGPDGGPTGSRRALLTGVHDPGDGPYPSSPALAQNYPNPFNPSTSIAYVIPAGHGNDMVRISVHDLLGRTVATLVSAIHPPGTYVTQWDGMSDRRSAAPSGVYVYSLRVGSLMETKKMILVR
jgi:hypothetical protein